MLTLMLYLLLCEVKGEGRCDDGLVTPLGLVVERLEDDICGCMEEAEVDVP